MTLSNYEFAELISSTPPKNAAGLAMINCPFHEDTNASLAIYPNPRGENGGCYCFGCMEYKSWYQLYAEVKNTTIQEAYRVIGDSSFSDDYIPLPPHHFQPSTLPDTYTQALQTRLDNSIPLDQSPEAQDFFRSKHIHLSVPISLGVKFNNKKQFKQPDANSALLFPYTDPDQHLTNLRFRHYDPTSKSWDKPKSLLGVPSSAWYHFVPDSPIVFFVEGEADFFSIVAHNLSAICLPGATMKRLIDEAVYEAVHHLTVNEQTTFVFCGDNDDAGQKMNDYALSSLEYYSSNIQGYCWPHSIHTKGSDINDELIAGTLPQKLKNMAAAVQPQKPKTLFDLASDEQDDIPMLSVGNFSIGDQTVRGKIVNGVWGVDKRDKVYCLTHIPTQSIPYGFGNSKKQSTLVELAKILPVFTTPNQNILYKTKYICSKYWNDRNWKD